MGIGNNKRTLLCPHCQQQIKVMVRTEIIEISTAEEIEDRSTLLSEGQRELIDEMKATGLFAQFERTISIAKGNALPRHPEVFLFTFLRTLSRLRVPSFVLKFFVKKCKGGRMEFLGGQGICVIIASGTIVGFAPQDLIALRKDGKPQRFIDEKGFQDWFGEENSLVWKPGQRTFAAIKALTHEGPAKTKYPTT